MVLCQRDDQDVFTCATIKQSIQFVSIPLPRFFLNQVTNPELTEGFCWNTDLWGSQLCVATPVVRPSPTF